MEKVIAAWGQGLICTLALGLAACNSDSSATPDSGDTPVTGNPTNPTQPTEPTDPDPTPTDPTNAAPQIVGSPGNEVLVGSNYSFAPNASDADGDSLSFTIQGQPSWADFNASTGRLSGTPGAGDVGSYEDIAISVSDGTVTRALPEFSIDVVEQGSGSVTLAWEPPTHNTDGSALTNLSGFRIHYGSESGNYDQTIDVENAGINRYVIENLTPGKYYFAISAVADGDVESDPSREASKTI